MNLSQIIRDLLLRNEQVVLPALGTLKVIHHPARISRTSQLLTPPSREIVLDNHIRQDDNQLLLTIRRKLALSEAEAEEKLKAYILGLEDSLKNDGVAPMEGLGKIRKNQAGKLQFEAEPDLLNPGNVFSLPEIEIPLPPAQKQPASRTVIPEAKSQTVIPEARPLPVPEARKRRRWWIPAALAVIVVIAVSLAYFAGILNNFIPERPEKKIVAAKPHQQERIVFGSRDSNAADTSSRASISRQIDRQTDKNTALRPSGQGSETGNNVPRTAVTSPVKPFQIISGSFSNPENADKQIEKFREKGIQAVLLPHTGKYYMVSVGAYNTMEQATADLQPLIDRLGMDLWVMKTKN
jgi:nucleoid DNA-binding protein